MQREAGVIMAAPPFHSAFGRVSGSRGNIFTILDATNAVALIKTISSFAAVEHKETMRKRENGCERRACLAKTHSHTMGNVLTRLTRYGRGAGAGACVRSIRIMRK